MASIIAEQVGVGSIMSEDERAGMMDKIPRILKPVVRLTIKGLQEMMSDIIGADPDKLQGEFDAYLKPFTLSLVSLGVTVADAAGDVEHLAGYAKDSNIKMKKMIEKLDIKKDEREKVEQIREYLVEYQLVFLILTHGRPAELQSAVSQFDMKDLLRSLYSTILALSCIVALASKKEYDTGKLAALVRIGTEHSENLSSYTETIDIMSNPETVKDLAKSDQWVREHYPDSFSE